MPRRASARRSAPAASPRKPTLAQNLASHVTRLEIAGVAMGVFATRGADRSRVEDILQASGIARRTFYRHFRNKDDVLAAVFDLVAAQLLEAMQGAAAESTDPMSAVRLGLDAYLDFHVDNAALLRVLIEQGLRSETPVAAARRRFQDGLIELLSRAIEATGRKRPDMLVFVAMLSALEGVSLHLLGQGATRADVARAKSVLHELIASALRIGS